MNENLIIEQIQSGKVSPLYLFFGPEECLLEETLKQAINILLDPSVKDFNFDTYHGENNSPSEIIDAAKLLPCMSKYRVIIVKKVDVAGAPFLNNESLLRYMESPNQETCLFFTAQKIKKQTKFFTLISKIGKTVHFPKLKSYELVERIQKRAKASQYKIEPAAAEYIAGVCNNNLQRIENELEKLFMYSGEVNFIDLDTAQLAAGNPKADSIFALTDAIGKQDAGNSLCKLENILAQGALPLVTLGMITRQFRLIWQAKIFTEKGADAAQTSSAIGVSPYFVGEIISQARKFSQNNLIYTFERLLQADLELKSSGKSPGLILESLIIDLCLPGKLQLKSS